MTLVFTLLYITQGGGQRKYSYRLKIEIFRWEITISCLPSCGCKILFLILMKTVLLLRNMVLKNKMFLAKNDEATGNWENNCVKSNTWCL